MRSVRQIIQLIAGSRVSRKELAEVLKHGRRVYNTRAEEVSRALQPSLSVVSPPFFAAF